ncbi:hypothetical protein NUW54_g10649 [Trametes sanguinea]|uniref:Uncharacterized protein n=1 Tax=Trametes sanguinea TaxID=158606 RepID=A0ACC1NWJ9_9APHY|nr:hypothetical protein NUW54_g10649 [Trametes sanguinea]
MECSANDAADPGLLTNKRPCSTSQNVPALCLIRQLSTTPAAKHDPAAIAEGPRFRMIENDSTLHSSTIVGWSLWFSAARPDSECSRGLWRTAARVGLLLGVAISSLSSVPAAGDAMHAPHRGRINAAPSFSPQRAARHPSVLRTRATAGRRESVPIRPIHCPSPAAGLCIHQRDLLSAASKLPMRCAPCRPFALRVARGLDPLAPTAASPRIPSAARLSVQLPLLLVRMHFQQHVLASMIPPSNLAINLIHTPPSLSVVQSRASGSGPCPLGRHTHPASSSLCDNRSHPHFRTAPARANHDVRPLRAQTCGRASRHLVNLTATVMHASPECDDDSLGRRRRGFQDHPGDGGGGTGGGQWVVGGGVRALHSARRPPTGASAKA